MTGTGCEKLDICTINCKKIIFSSWDKVSSDVKKMATCLTCIFCPNFGKSITKVPSLIFSERMHFRDFFLNLWDSEWKQNPINSSPWFFLFLLKRNSIELKISKINVHIELCQSAIIILNIISRLGYLKECKTEKDIKLNRHSSDSVTDFSSTFCIVNSYSTW